MLFETDYFLDLSTDQEDDQEIKPEPTQGLKAAVLDEKPLFTALLKDRTIENGNAARFDVRVRGRPIPEVTWYKDNKQIEQESFPNVKVFTEDDLHSILITDGRYEDTGVYKCVAKNRAGETSCVGHLFVEG